MRQEHGPFTFVVISAVVIVGKRWELIMLQVFDACTGHYLRSSTCFCCFAISVLKRNREGELLKKDERRRT